MIRVAFTGPKGCGKTTASAYLQNSQICRDLKMKFFEIAPPLKRAASEIFDLPYKVFDDPATKDSIHEYLGCKPRDVVKLLGELMAKIPNTGYVGVNPLLDRVLQRIDDTDSVCISDLRLPIESEEFKKAKILRVKIKNNRLASDPNPHSTEAGCEYDIEIDNSGSKEEFYDQIDKAIGLDKLQEKKIAEAEARLADDRYCKYSSVYGSTRAKRKVPGPSWGEPEPKRIEAEPYLILGIDPSISCSVHCVTACVLMRSDNKTVLGVASKMCPEHSDTGEFVKSFIRASRARFDQKIVVSIISNSSWIQADEIGKSILSEFDRIELTKTNGRVGVWVGNGVKGKLVDQYLDYSYVPIFHADDLYKLRESMKRSDVSTDDFVYALYAATRVSESTI